MRWPGGFSLGPGRCPEVLNVKVEESEGIPQDPFPSAITYIDENADNDIAEAQQDAPPAAAFTSIGLTSMLFKIKQSNLFSGLLNTPRLPENSSANTGQSTWTIYTEVAGSGPRCFVHGTLFLKSNGVPTSVEDLCIGDELQGPGKSAFVEQIELHAAFTPIVSIAVRSPNGTLCAMATHDHRMAMDNGDYIRACDVEPGDKIRTSEGECPVVGAKLLAERAEVFEIAIAEDRPIYMALQGPLLGMIAAFGSDRALPYHPDDYVEFRFKGRMCATMGAAEKWFSNFKGTFDRFGLKFWCSRKFAVWVPRNLADDFWEQATVLLPKGSKLYRRPSVLTVVPSSLQSVSIGTPPSITP